MKAIVSVFLLLSLCGCASKVGLITAEKWNGMRAGMTRDQVIEQLGSPRSSALSNNVERLRYVEDRGVFITRGTGIYQRYTVQFVDGRVVAYAPDQPDVKAEPIRIADDGNREPDKIRKRWSGWSTARLQLRRHQLGDTIPDTAVKLGLLGPDFTKERREKEDIEMELLRRFEDGDAAAELKPLPRDDQRKVRGGNF